MNIAGIGAVAAHQQRLDQLNNRDIIIRIICCQLRNLNLFCGNIGFFGGLLGADLRIVIFNCLADFHFLTEEHFQGHIHDLANILLRIKVQRI